MHFTPLHDADFGVFVTQFSVFPVRRVNGGLFTYDSVRRTCGTNLILAEGVFLGCRDHAELGRVCEQSRAWFNERVTLWRGQVAS